MTKDDVMMLANQTAGQHWMDEAHIQRFAVALISSEREDCAKLCDESAIRLFSGKSRVNQVDRHTAEVLRRHAEAIRARSNK